MIGQLPYVQFRVNGSIVSMTRPQYEQALRDAKLCRCGTCVCCEAVRYHREVTGKVDPQ